MSDEAEQLRDKLEWEGGIVGLLEYGSVQYFPDELHATIQELQDAYDSAKTAISDYLTRNGVNYW